MAAGTGFRPCKYQREHWSLSRRFFLRPIGVLELGDAYDRISVDAAAGACRLSGEGLNLWPMGIPKENKKKEEEIEVYCECFMPFF